MTVRKNVALLFFLAVFSLVGNAQDMPISYALGESYSDRYKFSTMLSINENAKGETILVRTYYGGLPLRPKGHFIEVYDADMNLLRDFNYKYAGKYMVDGFTRNGQLYLLELVYNQDNEAYEYQVHQSPTDEFRFKERTILSIPLKKWPTLLP